MNKKLLDRIEAIFIASLQSKTGWGRNEVIALYKAAVTQAVMEMLDA